MKIKAIIFDWGNTIMRDYNLPGPMFQWEKVDWIPGAEELLRQLQNKYICAIATNAPHSGREDMIKALKMLGADIYFQHFFSAKEIGHRKPDPRFFLAVCNDIGVKQEECYMIGDTYERDIIGAKEAGMSTIFFNKNSIPGNYPDADHIVNGLVEIIEII